MGPSTIAVQISSKNIDPSNPKPYIPNFSFVKIYIKTSPHPLAFYTVNKSLFFGKIWLKTKYANIEFMFIYFYYIKQK